MNKILNILSNSRGKYYLILIFSLQHDNIQPTKMDIFIKPTKNKENDGETEDQYINRTHFNNI
jgi:hypothetical protein